MEQMQIDWWVRENRIIPKMKALRALAQVKDGSISREEAIKLMTADDIEELTDIRTAELRKGRDSRGSYKAMSVKEIYDRFIYPNQYKSDIKIRRGVKDILKKEANDKEIPLRWLADKIISSWLAKNSERWKFFVEGHVYNLK